VNPRGTIRLPERRYVGTGKGVGIRASATFWVSGGGVGNLATLHDRAVAAVCLASWAPPGKNVSWVKLFREISDVVDLRAIPRPRISLAIVSGQSAALLF
jgi:hypothetical protein